MRYLPFVAISFLVLPHAFAQCVERVQGCVSGPVENAPMDCRSTPEAVGAEDREPCAEPLEDSIAFGMCHGSTLGTLGFYCCACTPQGVTSCVPQLRDAQTVDVFIRAPVLGVQSISVLENINATVELPPFDPGWKLLLLAVARKVDPQVRSRVTLQVCDSEKCISCDPVLTLVTRGPGRPVSETYDNLPERERYLTVYNGSPGVKSLTIEVNGAKFGTFNLKDGEEETLDLASAMQTGNGNVVTLRAQGKPGGSATIVIHD
jgi:hypothetical protein